MTITMCILIVPMWRNNISCFLLGVQNDRSMWLTTLGREYNLSRLARLLLLAKEAENANSHNSEELEYFL